MGLSQPSSFAALRAKGWPTRLLGSATVGDRLFQAVTVLAALAIIALPAAMVIYLWDGAWPAIARFGVRFVANSTWDPVRNVFGALPAIYGTLLTSFLAMLIAVPLSLAVAVFLAELAPRWLSAPASFLVEMLAAIPSVVLGLWGLFVLVPIIRHPIESWLGSHLGFLPLFKGPPFGVGFLAGGVILAVMALPIITAVARDSLSAVPGSQREAMLALGATRWEAISRAVVPYARSGIMAAAILGLGRALGETMAVTMVVGNGYQVTASLFAPGNTMASKIATEFNEASGDLYIGSLIELGLILFVIAFIVNVVGRLLVRWAVGKQQAGARW
ncbi:MAG: phosphate ABC transporter permease subunit PstC [Chloroflexi bacterium]|nr:phosphate ABC transporter permease subunit PstC [Chloroflexota bacterium]